MTSDNAVVLELAPLRGGKQFKPRPQNRSWNLLGVLFKIFDKPLRPFYMEVSPGTAIHSNCLQGCAFFPKRSRGIEMCDTHQLHHEADFSMIGTNQV